MSVGAGLEVLAQWDSSIRLVATPNPDGTRGFVVEELDREGMARSATPYSHDDLLDAIDDYHQRFIRLLDPPTASAMEVAVGFIVASGDRDQVLTANRLADEFTLIDHRYLGYPPLDKAGMLQGIAADAETRDRSLGSAFHAISPVGWVTDLVTWQLSHDRWYETEVGVWVTMVDSGRLTHLEAFPLGHVEESLARFDELTATR